MSHNNLSIVIPVYNGEQYISDCLKSIDDTDVEIIMVDDGSPSIYCDVYCDTYASFDKRLVVVHKVNEGVAKTRNMGLFASRGRFVQFLDQDDFWIEKPITPDVEYILQDSKADIIRFGFVITNEYKQIKESFVPPEYNLGLRDGAVDTLFYHHSSYMFNRNHLLNNHIIYPVNCGDVGDLGFVQMAAYKANSIFAFPHSLFGWRQNKQSVSHTQNIVKYDEDVYKVFLYLREFYEKEYGAEGRASIFFNAQLSLLYLRCVKSFTRICPTYSMWYNRFISNGYLQQIATEHETKQMTMPLSGYNNCKKIIKNPFSFYLINRFRFKAKDYGRSLKVCCNNRRIK